MKNVKLTLAYDGTNYFGWQRTKVGPNIEETLENALERILQCKVRLQAASRTDSGVHANGQIVNFFLTKPDAKLDRLKAGLNALLPRDIVVLGLEGVSETFHPTLNCIKKEYHYYLCHGDVQLPQNRKYSWHFPKALNIDKMLDAAELLNGAHDFSTFCNMRKGMHYEDFVREVYAIDIEELSEKRLRFRVIGNNFLYKMVRNLVGTIAYVGCEKISVEDVKKILECHDRKQAGMTAPAHGLFLQHVYYS